MSSTPAVDSLSDLEYEPLGEQKPSPSEVDLSSKSQHQQNNQHWESQRRKWTKGHKRYNSHQALQYNASHPSLKDIEGCDLNNVYKSLVAGKPLRTPIPLDFVTTVLVAGWKANGLWVQPPPEPVIPQQIYATNK